MSANNFQAVSYGSEGAKVTGDPLVINIHNTHFSMQELRTERQHICDIQQYYEYPPATIVSSAWLQCTEVSSSDIVCAFGVRFCLQGGLQVQLFSACGYFSSYLRVA